MVKLASIIQLHNLHNLVELALSRTNWISSTGEIVEAVKKI